MAAFAAGRLFLANGELERARELLDRAATLDPEAGAIQGARARLYRRLGEGDMAAAAATLAAQRNSPVTITDPIHFRMRQESVSVDRAARACASGD